MNVSRMLPRRLGRVGVVGAASIALLTIVPTAAQASWNSDIAVVYNDDCHNHGLRAARGWFEAYGDRFYLDDDCADGHSAMLEVDVAPYGGINHYDWAIVNSKGAGEQISTRRNLAEDTDVSVRVCVSEGDRPIGCGSWQSGRA